MKANELLLWLSARVQGSWGQFKAAVEELHLPDDDPAVPAAPEDDTLQARLPLHQALRLTLERLGHVEFFAAGCEGGWRAAPPVWAAFETEGTCSAVLCGARTLTLLHRVQTAVCAPVLLNVEDETGAPSTYRLTASVGADLVSAAVATGIPLQRDAPRTILCAIPRVTDMTEAIAELPLGRDWIVERFSAETQRWGASSREETGAVRDGLFRFRLPYQRRYFLRRRGCNYEMEGAAAKYTLLRRCRRRVVRFIPEARKLIVPASCRPPLLIERALVLCSGRLPAFDANNVTLTYCCVSPDVAKLAACVLEQEILA